MDNSKPWYTSKTIWGSIVQVIAALLVGLGVIGADDSASFLGIAPDAAVGIVGGVLALWNWYARATATKMIA